VIPGQEHGHEQGRQFQPVLERDRRRRAFRSRCGEAAEGPGRQREEAGWPAEAGQAGPWAAAGRSAGQTRTGAEALQPLKSGRPPKPPGAAPREQLDGQGLPYITLVQFLKKLNLVDSGGAGKGRVRAGGIQVNGTEELRPGRKLHQGDTVRFEGTAHTVTL
jgi:ribosome-associated protein YbcJ (S4-like RNA binding protein)